jgi:hypothetical protein
VRRSVWRGVTVAAVVAVAVSASACGGSGDDAGGSARRVDRQAAIEVAKPVRVCVVNQLRDPIKPRTIIPSVWFQPGELEPGGETCEKDSNLSGPDVCFDVERRGQIIARVGVSTFLGSMTVRNADRCENESAPDRRTAYFGSDLTTAEIATETDGVKVCLNRWEKYQLTAYVAPADRACTSR